MQNINFEHIKGKGFHITDFPNAEKVVKLEGQKAQELADMSLHRSDLLRATEYLQLSIDSEDSSIHEKIFWEMAITSFIKCFGKNKGRERNLEITTILPGDTLGQEVFLFFKNLRDKNITHDENPISQCLVGAVINKLDASCKVEKIITMPILGEMNSEGNIKNLKDLISRTLNFVEIRYDKLCIEITKELELQPHAELIEMENLSYTVPTAEDVSGKRKKLL